MFLFYNISILVFFHRLTPTDYENMVFNFEKHLHVFKSLLSMPPISQRMRLRHTESRFHFGSNIWKYKVDKDKGPNMRSKHIPSFLIIILLDWWVSLINLLVGEK